MATTAERKWTGKTGGGSIGQRALLALLRVTDVRVAYAVAAVAVPFYMVVNREGYRAIRDYLRRRHGYRGMRLLRGIYRNHFLFAQMMIDRFAIFAAGHNRFGVEVIGREAFDKLLDGDEGFVVAGSHIGNFEISGYLLHQTSKVINSVVYGGESETVQRNRSRLMESNHLHLIPVSDDMSHLFAIKQALDEGQIVSSPCDRLLGSRKSIECDLLGGRVELPMGMFLLAAQLEKKMVSIFVVKIAAKRYRVIVAEVEVDRSGTSRTVATRLAKEYCRQMERVLALYPLQWFNFYPYWKDNV